MKNELKILIETINKVKNINKISFIDIGARWGIQRPWDKFPKNYLCYWGIDADAEECNRLNNKVSSSECVKFLPFALSDQKSSETLYLTKEEGRSSIYKPNYKYINKFYDWDGFSIKKEIALKTSTLNYVFSENNIKPDFIKIDTQGAELKILKGGSQYLNDLLALEIEVEFIPMYENQPLFSDIDSYLRSKGFEIYDLNRYWAYQRNMNHNCSNRGQLIFGDAIYFRSIDSFFSMNFNNENEKKEKFLKILCIFFLYGFFDTAIEYLHHSKAPFRLNETKSLEKEIISISSYPRWQKIFFNNKYALKISKLLEYLANMLSYKRKSFGWGTDYNTINGRYLYYISDKFSKIFGKK